MLRNVRKIGIVVILVGLVSGLALRMILVNNAAMTKKQSDSQVNGAQTKDQRTEARRTDNELDSNSAVALTQTKVSMPQETIDKSLVDRFDDPRELIRGYMGMTYELLQACVQQDEIPQLHQMLNDENEKVYWPVIAAVIGLVSKDEGSVPVLLDYFQRDDVENLASLDFLVMKASIPQNIGKIGGRHAKKVLMRLYDRQELEESIRKWIASDNVKARWPSKEQLIAYIRGNVCYGLLYLQDQEAYDFVKKQYLAGLREYQLTKVGTPLWYNLVYAMGLKDCIDEIGMDRMFSLDYEEKMKVTRSYMYKYAPHLKKTGLQGTAQKVNKPHP